MAGPAEDDPEQQQQEANEAVADDGDEGPLRDGCPHDGQRPAPLSDQHRQLSCLDGKAHAEVGPQGGRLSKEAVLSSTLGGS